MLQATRRRGGVVCVLILILVLLLPMEQGDIGRKKEKDETGGHRGDRGNMLSS